MPSSEKPTKTTPGNASQPTKAKPKANQRQEVETSTQGGQGTAAEAVEAATTRARKTSSKLSATKERPAVVPRVEARDRKPTPQQQIHQARARRRRLNERLGLGTLALVVIVVVVVVIQQAIAKSDAATRLANANASGTSTAIVRSTATEIAVAPDSPPAVTGTPVKLAGGLQYIDLTVGTGTAAKTGDTVNMQYVGWNTPQANCIPICKFDSSYDPPSNGKPFTFTLGAGQAIPGWDQGIVGMKPGGKRRLIIPPALAYGAQGSGKIPPNATIIFDVQLMSITPAGA